MLAEINKAVEDGQGAAVLTVETLRKELGFGRMGVHVRRKISESLESEGLKVWPREIPSSQTEMVRIYDPQTELGRLIENIVAKPSQRTEVQIREFTKARNGKLAKAGAA